MVVWEGGWQMQITAHPGINKTRQHWGAEGRRMFSYQSVLFYGTNKPLGPIRAYILFLNFAQIPARHIASKTLKVLVSTYHPDPY